MEGLNKTMFREYDIRGRVNAQELNPASFGRIIQGYSEYLHKRGIKSVVVGCDNRQHSQEFLDIACSLLANQGFVVYDLGLALSPVLYYSQYFLGAQGGVMITASHNPPEWNGLKLACGFSRTLEPEDIRELYDLCLKPPKGKIGGGSVKKVNIRDIYLAEIVKRVGIDHNHDLRVMLDCANGGAGVFVYELFQALGCKTFQLNCDPDSSYPNYFPNPSLPSSRRRMKELVAHPYIHADLALSFDGDGDRLGLVGPGGEDIWSDRLLIILAAEVLRSYPGADIIYDVKSSRSLIEAVNMLGGKGVMCPTGHSYVKRELKNRNSPLAGERSGHIFLGRDLYYGYDDALMAGAYLIGIMAKRGKSLEELLAPYPRYTATEEINIPCSDQEKYSLVARIKKRFLSVWGADKINTINGIRLELPSGWALLRASSNLPQLVLVAEGEDDDKCANMLGIMMKALEDEGININK